MRSNTLTAGIVTAFAAAANGHTLFTTLYINDVGVGDGTCVRMPKDPATATAPIADIKGTDMACG
jgi:hypothetical protein